PGAGRARWAPPPRPSPRPPCPAGNAPSPLVAPASTPPCPLVWPRYDAVTAWAERSVTHVLADGEAVAVGIHHHEVSLPPRMRLRLTEHVGARAAHVLEGGIDAGDVDIDGGGWARPDAGVEHEREQVVVGSFEEGEVDRVAHGDLAAGAEHPAV